MKRWLVAVLVLLAIIVLISPSIIGRLAEKNLEESLSWAEDEARDIVVTTESFDRGWFTSEGRYRVEIRDPDLRDFVADGIGAGDGDSLPSLIIDSRLDHGIVPFTSLARDHGSLQPGLASTVSTFQLDQGDGQLIPLPGKLFSTVAFSGESESRYLLEAGKFEEQDVRVEWQGADFTFFTNPGNRSMVVDGTIDELMLVLGGDTIRFDGARISGHQDDVGYDFGVGAVSLEIDSVAVEGGGNAVSGFSSMTLEGDTRLADSRVSGTSKMALSELQIPGFGNVDFVMDMAVNGLDAEALQALTRAAEEAEQQMGPATDFDSIYPAIEQELQRLLAAGAEVRVEQLDITFPQGTLETNMHIEIPGSGDPATFDWGSMMLQLVATANMRVPVELYEFVQLMNPQADSLADMGIFRPDGEYYVMEADYRQGLLNINGAPMPMPLPQ